MYYASPNPQDKGGNIYIPGPPGPATPSHYAAAAAAQVGPPTAQQVLPNGLTATAARFNPHNPHTHPTFAVVSTPGGGHHPAAYAATNVYSSMPYHPGVAVPAGAIPTSSHATAPPTFLSAAAATPQFHPAGTIGFHPQQPTMTALAGRSVSVHGHPHHQHHPHHHHPAHHQPTPTGHPPHHFAALQQQPVQAGAPLFAAAGYTTTPLHQAGGIHTAATANPPPGATTRTIPMGPAAFAATGGLPPGYAATAAFPPAVPPTEVNAAPQLAYAPAGYMPQF